MLETTRMMKTHARGLRGVARAKSLRIRLSFRHSYGNKSQRKPADRSLVVAPPDAGSTFHS